MLNSKRSAIPRDQPPPARVNRPLAGVKADYRFDIRRRNLLLKVRVFKTIELVRLIKPLAFRQYASVHVTSSGMRFIVSEANALQVVADIPSLVFSHYEFTSEREFQFGIRVQNMIDLLYIFQTSTSEGMFAFCKNDNRLYFSVREGQSVVGGSLVTVDRDEVIGVEMSGLLHEFTLQRNALRMLTSIDWSALVIVLAFEKAKTVDGVHKPGRLQLIAKTHRVDTCIGIVSTCDQLKGWKCVRDGEYHFKASLLKRITRCLKDCDSSRCDVDSSGTLCMRFLMHTSWGQASTIEFVLQSVPPDPSMPVTEE